MIDTKKPTIKANNLFLYYKDLAAAQDFYEVTLGLKRVLDYGFASIRQISPTTYISLVDETRGMHSFTETKAVDVAFGMRRLRPWARAAEKHAASLDIHELRPDSTGRNSKGFIGLDPQGYTLIFRHAEFGKDGTFK